MCGILALIVILVVATILVVAIQLCLCKRQVREQTIHVKEAIDALNLWDRLNEPAITLDTFMSIKMYLAKHRYEHWLTPTEMSLVLSEIRLQQELKQLKKEKQ